MITDYSIIADIYDLLYRERSDVSYYFKEAKKAKGKVLEIGCGTGRVMLPLLEKGIDIEGLDISSTMIKILKEKAKAKNLSPTVYVKDMKNFNLNKKYSLILIPLRTFMHLSNDIERMRVLKNCYKHLSKNGKLIIHLYNKEAFKKTRDFYPIQSNFFDIGGEKIMVIWYQRYNQTRNKIEFLIEASKKYKKVRRFLMPLYFIDNKKMEEMLKETGFKKITIYSDFGQTKFSELKKTKEMLVVAIK